VRGGELRKATEGLQSTTQNARKLLLLRLVDHAISGVWRGPDGTPKEENLKMIHQDRNDSSSVGGEKFGEIT
jgi:hypothetical protein